MGKQSLKEHVAVVAGATRGAGRGIARMLGEAGATVYCTGRSTRERPRRVADRPETIEETADLVSAAGGAGIPVYVDHTVEDEVAALFQRVERDHGRVDVTVNVLTGQVVSWKGFLDDTPSVGREFVDSWVWSHVTTAWHAAKLMSAGSGGLLIELVEQGNEIGYHGGFYFDFMETLLKRLTFALAHDLGTRGITAVAVQPGFMRTEAILDHMGVAEENWRDAEERGKAHGWGGSESPQFVGRAVAALAADPEVARWNGAITTAWDLSEHYDFTDVDGSRPDQAVLHTAQEAAKKTFLAPLLAAASTVAVEWQVKRRVEDIS